MFSYLMMFRVSFMNKNKSVKNQLIKKNYLKKTNKKWVEFHSKIIKPKLKYNEINNFRFRKQ